MITGAALKTAAEQASAPQTTVACPAAQARPDIRDQS
jgi:hypothetical protein